MSAPPAWMSTLDLSTLRVRRDGGDADADIAFRAELFRRIGAVTVAGGAVETAMKRLLLVFAEKEDFSIVDKNWTDLHKALVKQCTEADDRRVALAKLVAWGDANRVKDRRDNVVHAYWWAFDGCGVRRARYFRKGPKAIISATLADLDEDTALLFSYADKLDQLLGDDWPVATLPKVP